MRNHLNEAVYTSRRSAIREFSKLAANTPGCVRLTLGEPDFNTPAEVSAEAWSALKRGETHYIENNGARALRDAIAAFEARENGMDYGEDEIIVTAGATEALFVALYGILNPGDEVIIPMPAFVLYEEICKLCRARVVPLDTTADEFQIRRKALEPLITGKTKAILLNSPNNPTGCVYDGESLETVRSLVKTRPIFVLCDDVYRQLCYMDHYYSFSEFRELREQILVIQSFSKPYAMTGWRVGYLMADRSVKERLELVHQFMVVSTPAPFQQACITALAADVSPMLREYRVRRDYVIGRLEAMGLRLVVPEGAFYAFPSIAEFGIPSTEFCERLVREAGVAVTPGVAFGEDAHIRLSYCCSMADLEKGLDRLETFLRELRAQ